MRSHDSWQCLSVQEFFSLCNWQGQPLESRNGQHQDQVLQLTLQAAEATGAKHQTSWQCLSVEEFFNLSNWQGQPLENTNGHHREPSSRLQEQVREFFQFIPWEGNPEIGSLPKVSSIPGLTLSACVETTLTDLSELF